MKIRTRRRLRRLRNQASFLPALLVAAGRFLFTRPN
jgi:hypothetical protein